MPERLNSLFFWVPSTLLGRSSVGARVRLRNGATILHSSWPITLTAMVLQMGPLYTVALCDGSVVHGGPIRWVRCIHGGPIRSGSVVHGGPLRPRARMVQIAGSVRASVCVCAGGGGVWVFVWASVRASVCGLVCGLVRYTPQPSRGGAVPCRRRRAVRCCLGRYSLLLATRLSHHTWRGYAVPQASRNAVLAGSL